MSIISDFFVSSESVVAGHINVKTLPAGDYIEFGGLLELEISILWAIVDHREWNVDLLDQFTLVSNESEVDDLATYRLSTAFVESLANMTESHIPLVAKEWAATDELNCKPSECEPVVRGIANLCLLAKSSSRPLYFQRML